jgi:hypothetical protein
MSIFCLWLASWKAKKDSFSSTLLLVLLPDRQTRLTFFFITTSAWSARLPAGDRLEVFPGERARAFLTATSAETAPEETRTATEGARAGGKGGDRPPSYRCTGRAGREEGGGEDDVGERWEGASMAREMGIWGS